MIFSKSQIRTIVSLFILCAFAPAMAAEKNKIGILLGFTGPIESLTPNMAQAAELAIKEANDSGLLHKGIQAVRKDSTCIDTYKAITAGRELMNSGVKNIVGTACSTVAMGVYENVIKPNGMIMISPSANAPRISNAPYQNLFRTVFSDVRPASVLAEEMKKQSIHKAVISYSDDEYGYMLADTFRSKANMMHITVDSFSHDPYSYKYIKKHVKDLESTKADSLVIITNRTDTAKEILNRSLEKNAFKHYFLGPQMSYSSIPPKEKGIKITTIKPFEPSTKEFTDLIKKYKLK